MHADAEFTGKYERPGLVGGVLVDGFYRAVKSLLAPRLTAEGTLMEVGCGAGYSTLRLREWLPQGSLLGGSDIGLSLLRKATGLNAGVPFVQQSVYDLAMPDKSVDVLVMMEVLEHLDEPERALAELSRVARRHVLISTPREPLWRILNFCRGKYMKDLGNTPGHIQHWSSRGLRALASSRFRIEGMRQPVPWTVLLLTPRA